MSKKEPVIVVAGDVTVDWFMYPVDNSDRGENWRLHTSSHADALPGGAALLTEFIRQSLKAESIPVSATGPRLSEPLRDIPPEKVIHSNVMLDRFQIRGGEAKVLRISKSLGYIGPRSDLPQPVPPEHDFKDADIIVFDDDGSMMGLTLIESYSAIRELIIKFLANPKPKQPLCFAVFGPPGSGKSFGVKQILKDIDRDGDKLKRITFNISQFDNYQDLVAAFHDVRDIVLEGKVPFVFFDEFDSVLYDQRLGWLKYFLTPMQDGEFRDGESTHPLGNAIFVFAGGTKSTYENFVRNLPENNPSAVSFKGGDDEPRATEEAVKEEDAKKTFRDAKGPDFISRLRGRINVMGPNRQRRGNDCDDVFIIRRAKILRTLLKNDSRASGLFNSEDELSIDEGVLRAMLYVTMYEHGTRSMNALIKMSRLEGKKRYDLSALPVREQLGLHVDADEFLFLTKMERYQSMLRMQDLMQRPRVLQSC